MSDPNPTPENKFDPEGSPFDAQESEQGEASGYGIYGYSNRAGQSDAMAGKIVQPDEPIITSEPPPPGIGPEFGGQDQLESAHGSGLAQPMEGPQRFTNRSALPGEETAKNDES